MKTALHKLLKHQEVGPCHPRGCSHLGRVWGAAAGEPRACLHPDPRQNCVEKPPGEQQHSGSLCHRAGLLSPAPQARLGYLLCSTHIVLKRRQNVPSSPLLQHRAVLPHSPHTQGSPFPSPGWPSRGGLPSQASSSSSPPRLPAPTPGLAGTGRSLWERPLDRKQAHAPDARGPAA